MSGLPILQGVAPAPDIYARALSAAYRLHFRIIDPDFAQQRDYDVWEKLRRDGKVSQAINQRTSAIRLANLVKIALEEIRNFREARKQLAMGVFRGRAYGWSEGDRKLLDLTEDGNTRNWWVPTGICNIDKRRIQIVPRKDEIAPGKFRLITYKEIWSPTYDRYIELQPLDYQSLIELVYDDEEGRLGYGRGIIESLYFLWWAKQIILQEGLQGLERWAQGIIVGRIDTERAGKKGKNSEERRSKMSDELHKMRSKHAIVVDRDDDLTVVTGGGEGHQMVKAFLDYCDQGILGIAMGSVLPFGSASDVGSMARAEVEEDTSEQIIQYDRSKLDEVLTQTVVRAFIRLNQPHLAELGLLGLRMPRFLTTQQKKEDKQVNATVIETALRAGISLRKDEVYEKIGFTQPSDEDEVIEASPALMGPMAREMEPAGKAAGGGDSDQAKEGSPDGTDEG